MDVILKVLKVPLLNKDTIIDNCDPNILLSKEGWFAKKILFVHKETISFV